MKGAYNFPITAVCTLAVLISVHFLIPTPEWMAEGGHWFRRALLHPFFHANVFHLAVNCIVAWGMLARRDRRGWLSLLLGFPLAVIGYAAAVRLTIGFSNVLCAIMGIRTPSFRDGWWRRGTVIISLVSLAVLSLLPGISATTHIASFALGVLLSRVWDYVKRLGDDCGKIIRR